MRPDLSTKYLGLTLANPVAASASPLTGRMDMLRRLEDAGASAVVLPSLFEEQIEHEELEIERLHAYGADSSPEAFGYHPVLNSYNTGPDPYLEHVRRAKGALSIPVIGSLNGVTPGGWVHYARLIQDAGADALELNVYYVAADPDISGPEVEQRYLDLVARVREEITIPLAVKISPFFSSPAFMARRLVEAGANGLVLFNRFMQPDIDLDALAVRPNLELSSSFELRLPLRWTAILRGRLDASIATTSGAHTARDVIKLVLAGADATMMTSAILKHGPEYVTTVVHELETWLTEREYTSIEQMKGSMSQQHCAEPEAFERANYMAALATHSSRYAWR